MEKITVIKLAERIPTEASAYEYLETVRWKGKPVCPHCGSINEHKYLEPKNGVSRETNRGKQSERRVWKCKDCKKQFSVTTGTVMHGSKIPLRTWVFVMFEMSANKNGIAAREIERKYGVAPKSAWFMAHRLREAMKENSPRHLVGTIVSDETWIGSNPKNWHSSRHKEFDQSGAFSQKKPVVSLVNKDTGEIRSRTIPKVTGARITEIMRDNVDMSRSHLETDSGACYGPISSQFLSHTRVNHLQGEYVAPNGGGTNKLENYFSQLKRSLDGTYHHVSEEHLDRYLHEFDFRYSTREFTDTARMDRLIGQTAGKRLFYKKLI